MFTCELFFSRKYPTNMASILLESLLYNYADGPGILNNRESNSTKGDTSEVGERNFWMRFAPLSSGLSHRPLLYSKFHAFIYRTRRVCSQIVTIFCYNLPLQRLALPCNCILGMCLRSIPAIQVLSVSFYRSLCISSRPLYVHWRILVLDVLYLTFFITFINTNHSTTRFRSNIFKYTIHSNTYNLYSCARAWHRALRDRLSKYLHTSCSFLEYTIYFIDAIKLDGDRWLYIYINLWM